MLYTLNIYSDVCQLYLNKTGKKIKKWGACVAQLVKRPTSVQVMISRFMSSNPMLDSVLAAQSLEPASDSVSLSLCPFPACTLSLSQKINIH